MSNMSNYQFRYIRRAWMNACLECLAERRDVIYTDIYTRKRA